MSTETGAAETALADDIMRGMDPIAAFLGVSLYRAYRLAEGGQIPVTKEGGVWIGLKTVLKEHYRNPTRATETTTRRQLRARRANARM